MSKNELYALPKAFSICYENTELVEVYRGNTGKFTGEIKEYSKYLARSTDRVTWFDEDVKYFLETRVIPASRPKAHMQKSLEYLGMTKWDLEALIVKTRGFRAGDAYWVRFFKSELYEKMSPFIDGWKRAPFIYINEENGVAEFVVYPRGYPEQMKLKGVAREGTIEELRSRGVEID